MLDLEDRKPEEPLTIRELGECKIMGEQFVAIGQKTIEAKTVGDIIAIDDMVDNLNVP